MLRVWNHHMVFLHTTIFKNMFLFAVLERPPFGIGHRHLISQAHTHAHIQSFTYMYQSKCLQRTVLLKEYSSLRAGWWNVSLLLLRKIFICTRTYPVVYGAWDELCMHKDKITYGIITLCHSS